MGNQVLSIHKPASFNQQLDDSIRRNFKAEHLTDFTILIEDEAIKVHKLVLAARSPYFDAMFRAETVEKINNFVRLDPLDAKAVNAIIEFCYTGELSIELHHMNQYLEAIELFQLTELKPKLEKFIYSKLNNDNCVGFLYVANKFQLRDVRKKSKEIMLTRFSYVSQGIEFKQLTLPELKNYLQENIIVPSQDTVFAACINWMSYDGKTRWEHLETMLEHIQPTKCSQAYINDVLQTHKNELVKNPAVYQMITEALLSTIPGFIIKKGQMVVCGGMTEDNKLTNQIQAVMIATGTVDAVTDIPKVSLKFDPAICITPNGLFTAGGQTKFNTRTATTQCSLYSFKYDSWSDLPPLSSASYGAGAVCVGEMVFVIGGYVDREDVMEMFDTTTKKWSLCPQLLQKLCYPIICAIGHLIFVIFNTASGNKSFRKDQEMSLQCFDKITSVWSFKAALPSDIEDTAGANAVAVGDNFYLVGGTDKLCMMYSPSSDAWMILTNCHQMHRYGAAAYIDGKVVVCGGAAEKTGNKLLSTVEAYDTETDTWEICQATLPIPIRDCVGFSK